MKYLGWVTGWRGHRIMHLIAWPGGRPKLITDAAFKVLPQYAEFARLYPPPDSL